MIWEPKEGSGLELVFEHLISYCDSPQSDWQLSVPPNTPPSSRTMAPLLT
jgi:hypothetical protein